jgi:signal transduction histidine kinase
VTAMRATAEISRVLAGETDLEVVLALIAKRGRALVGARALVIELAVADRLQIAAVAGDVDPALVGRKLSTDKTVAGHVLQTRTPQRLTDKFNRARFEESGLGALGMTARAGLFVPLGFRAETPGVLAVFDPLAGAEFTADDERLLTSFATSAASAVVTARSLTMEQLRARELATEQERRRWARELHDETLQGLGALRLGLSTARRTDDPERWRTAVDDAVLQLDTEIANLRGIISDVRPAALDELGVAAALESLVDRMRSRGLDVELALDLDYEGGRSTTRHAEDLETAIYRIAQESLNNVLNHAATDAVVVEVAEAGGNIVVRVSDKGRGFDTAVKGAGFGLLGIRERAGLLGGTAEIDSAPGLGTTVTARLPVHRRDADQPLRAPDPAADTAAATRSAASSSRT